MKKAIFFALGGHIATQNTSFKRLAEKLEEQNFNVYGGKDGFECFETGEVYPLKYNDIPERFSGFVAGAGRYSLTDKSGQMIPKKVQKAVDFFKRGGFDVAVTSGGDDHGLQSWYLQQALEGKVGVYVLNKTMDNDLGGRDGIAGAPYTDFTNGFHTAVTQGVEMIKQHFSGAWTNNLPYLVGHFGREANWVGIALAHWGNADRLIYGFEDAENAKPHTVDRIHDLIVESQEENERKFGRRFAMVVVPEGTRITGMSSASEDLIDAHGHHKLQPELLVNSLKIELEKRFGLKTQTVGITYEMRNFVRSEADAMFARNSADVIAKAINHGNSGVESIFKLAGNENYAFRVMSGVVPIKEACQKRLARYYPKPLINLDTLKTTSEIGNYYRTLFGEREPIESWLPNKMVSVRV